jgi:hypothetical protein
MPVESAAVAEARVAIRDAYDLLVRPAPAMGGFRKYCLACECWMEGPPGFQVEHEMGCAVPLLKAWLEKWDAGTKAPA